MNIPLLLTNLLAVLLTICVLSRIIGDNPAFRIVQYLFVGVSLGYSFVVLYHQVLVPAFLRIATSAAQGRWMLALLLVVPFLLSLLLLPRVSGLQMGSWLANFPLGLIFGVGTALALVGALMGTLLPQVLATLPNAESTPLQLVSMVVMALGVIFTVSYFYFTASRKTISGLTIEAAALLGRGLLMITFGFFFAGALVTYLTALSERFDFLIGLVGQ